jgi:hypothetical protein
MRPFEQLVTELLIESGLNQDNIKTRSGVELPGYFRPEKKWDLIVVSQGQLIAAIEFKSMVGSFGNNMNNRAEEAIGNAKDIWIAFREGRFGLSAPPFLGYFFLLQDDPRVHRPQRGFKEPNFQIDPAYRGTSYATRLEIMCRRFIHERFYTSACLILSSSEGGLTQPSQEISFQRFIATLRGHLSTVREISGSS